MLRNIGYYNIGRDKEGGKAQLISPIMYERPIIVLDNLVRRASPFFYDRIRLG